MSSPELFPNATGVLHSETLKMLEANFSHRTQAIIDGWAAQNPKALKNLEKAGDLLERAKEPEEEEIRAQQRAVEDYGAMPPLSNWEIVGSYGGALREL